MTTENTDKRYCTQTRKDGHPCHGWADSSGLCPVHRSNAREIQVLGGQSRSRRHQLETRLPTRLKPVLDLLAMSMEQVHKGQITPAQGSAIAALAGALCKVSELTDLEIRISTLEIRLLKKGARTWEN